MDTFSVGCYCLLLLVTYIHMAPVEHKVDYTGHQVIRVHPVTEEHLLLLDELEENPDYNIDFWSEPIANYSIDLHLPPDLTDNITHQITEAGMTYETLIPNIQDLINHEEDPYSEEDVGEFFAAPLGLNNVIRRTKRAIRRRKSTSLSSDYDGDYDDEESLDFYRMSPMGRYARHDEINTWLRMIPNYRPEVVRVLDIGYSFEGRNLKVIKIGSVGHNKPAIWIDAGLHAREWISPATAVCLIHILVALYMEDESVTQLINAYDWYILPVGNPDGYEFTHTTDRMWRKTRSFSQSTYNTRCRGVDANRNFDFEWLGHCDSNLFSRCRSTQPCASTYAGERPFSEMETVAIANFILQRRDQLKMYISLHSYSQLWLTPWAHTTQKPDDNRNIVKLAKASVEALQAVYNTSYRTGSPASLIYAAGGTSYDWAKGIAGINYSYTIELRDTGHYGFLLPQRHIVPVCWETWQGIKVAALQLLDELY